MTSVQACHHPRTDEAQLRNRGGDSLERGQGAEGGTWRKGQMRREAVVHAAHSLEGEGTQLRHSSLRSGAGASEVGGRVTGTWELLCRDTPLPGGLLSGTGSLAGDAPQSNTASVGQDEDSSSCL